MKEEKLYVTAQGRLPRDLTRFQRKALSAYGELFGKLERKFIADSCAKRDIEKSKWLKDHKISGRQFNAIERSAKGMMDSQLATKELVRYAKQVGKPLVIEKLDFAAKKAALTARSSGTGTASFIAKTVQPLLRRMATKPGI